MCLTKITTTYAKPSDLILDGWKEFTIPPFKFQNFGGMVTLNAWLKAEEVEAPKEIKASDGKKYQAGFHIYTKERKYRGRRVYYRRVTCIGDQDGDECVIALEMYVPSNQDDWPPQGPAPASKKRLIDRIKGAQ